MSDDFFRSPLELIEQAVLACAKDRAVDVSSSDGAQQMRSLIDQEIEHWNLDYRRGLKPFDLTDTELVAERAYRNLTGYGPLGPLLADDDVWEVMITVASTSRWPAQTWSDQPESADIV